MQIVRTLHPIASDAVTAPVRMRPIEEFARTGA